MKMLKKTVAETATLLSAHNVEVTYGDGRGGKKTILHDVSLDVRDGEVVALVGASGAGKSTLLRVLAGLVEPSAGNVLYRGRQLTGANPGAGFVFQSAALLPWLTVQKNVEVGLEARGIGAQVRAEFAREAIASMGLAGYEDSYPRDLSGGQRQRVGIARALVLHPDMLFMDEPFSALDAPTAERLRREVAGLLGSEDRIVRSVVIVTHGIEEAVEMADRVIVMGANPGHIFHELPIDLPRPRDARDPAFQETADALRALLGEA